MKAPWLARASRVPAYLYRILEPASMKDPNHGSFRGSISASATSSRGLQKRARTHKTQASGKLLGLVLCILNPQDHIA